MEWQVALRTISAKNYIATVCTLVESFRDRATVRLLHSLRRLSCD